MKRVEWSAIEIETANPSVEGRRRTVVASLNGRLASMSAKNILRITKPIEQTLADSDLLVGFDSMVVVRIVVEV